MQLNSNSIKPLEASTSTFISVPEHHPTSTAKSSESSVPRSVCLADIGEARCIPSHHLRLNGGIQSRIRWPRCYTLVLLFPLTKAPIMEPESKSEYSATTTGDIRQGSNPNGLDFDSKYEESKEPQQPQHAEEEYRGPKRNFKFWLVFVALCCSLFLSSLDLGGVGTAAPTIVHDLQGVNFSWVGSAYALGAASCLPLSGNLAQIFGRRPILLGSLVLFAVGSAVAGSARSMTALIIGRAVQGVAGGGIQALTSIVTADLIPLRERGVFNGITGLVWTLGSVIGPFIAGSLASKASWRWLFYMNIPLCFLAFVVVACFLNVKTPRENLTTKLLQVDWLGNVFIISSTCSCMLGLSWAGIVFPWSSPQVLVPLIVGLLGLLWSVYYESRWPAKPTIPLLVLSNRTTVLGYIATLLHGIVAISVGFYLYAYTNPCSYPPLMFEPLLQFHLLPFSKVDWLQKRANIGRSFSWGWCFMLLGIGLIYYMNIDTPIWQIVIFQLIQGFGMGLLYATTFAVQAPLPVSENASAVSLITFCRTFSQAWGISITGTILQNRLRHSLPASLLSQFPENTEIAYSIIPQIPEMSEPLKGDVQKAFLDSMRLAWVVMEAVCAAGLLTFFFMKDVPLRRTTDKQWSLAEKVKSGTQPDAKVPAEKL
ncbi:MFS general substrate transporter [Mycena venus]|uniref:MFS general substrate transporter n=1 Tax=Mycena venus TaxID=2733690 RepID=A0A8H7CJN0_9AGAR|nr:MFS general substrate transporter [Mycena venus]